MLLVSLMVQLTHRGSLGDMWPWQEQDLSVASMQRALASCLPPDAHGRSLVPKMPWTRCSEETPCHGENPNGRVGFFQQLWKLSLQPAASCLVWHAAGAQVPGRAAAVLMSKAATCTVFSSKASTCNTDCCSPAPAKPGLNSSHQQGQRFGASPRWSSIMTLLSLP